MNENDARRWTKKDVLGLLDVWWDTFPENYLRVYDMQQGKGIWMINYLRIYEPDLYHLVRVQWTAWSLWGAGSA